MNEPGSTRFLLASPFDLQADRTELKDLSGTNQEQFLRMQKLWDQAVSEYGNPKRPAKSSNKKANAKRKAKR